MNATAQKQLQRQAALAAQQTGPFDPHAVTADYSPREQDSGQSQAISFNFPAGSQDATIDGSARPHPMSANVGAVRYVFKSGDRPLEGHTIKRAIGRGGFGEVYYAVSDSGKEVALKLIVRNLEIEQRGVRECMNLKCPNLVTVYDLKTSDQGEHFVIMEYVRGPSLAAVLAQHPNGMPLEQVRFWLQGLVAGVDYLHEHGIVHRDLKPANLFLEEGYVKIGDYGLAKHINESQGAGHSDSIGTCHYMAPEISKGRYDKSIDIYAIGIIIHEMITGHAPFQGSSVGEILMKHLTELPDASMLPQPYRRMVEWTLAKDPARRPRRASEILSLLASGMSIPEVAFPDDKPPHRSSNDDVLRIGMDEDVVYIGPEAPRRPQPQRHPQQQQQQQQQQRRPWLKVNQQQRQRQMQGRAALPPPLQAVRPAVAPAPREVKPVATVAAPVVASVTAPAPVVAKEPPQLPSGRIRLAELSGSMTTATLLSAVLTAPMLYVLDLDLLKSPETAAFVFMIATLGSWLLMLLNKLNEGREPAQVRSRRRWGAVLTGLALGGAGWLLSDYTHLRMSDQRIVDVAFGSGLNTVSDGLVRPNGLTSLAFFATALTPLALCNLTGRERKSRFRMLPTLWAVATAVAASALWPFPQPWGIAAVALLAVVVQLASPWGREYASYAKSNRRWAA